MAKAINENFVMKKFMSLTFTWALVEVGIQLNDFRY